jgi:protein-S-isoprenylcysteine O-methyltransferase Ste14
MIVPGEDRAGSRSIWTCLRNLLGVGPHLLLLGIALEGLTMLIRRWVTLPIPLTLASQALLAVPCVILCAAGIIWFNVSLDLVAVHLSSGKQELLADGPFAYVRHPLYAVVMLTTPPLVVIWVADWVFLIPWILTVVSAHGIVRLEERGLVDTFGEDYDRYRELVPALIPYKGAAGKRTRDQLPWD